MEAGLTKADIRAASHGPGPAHLGQARDGLPGQPHPLRPAHHGRASSAGSSRPSTSCSDLGFASCRVRDHDTVARIEVPAGQIDRLLAPARARSSAALKALGYTYVTLDLQGFRSGSMYNGPHVACTG